LLDAVLYLLTLLIGVLAGFLGALLGIGGGMIIVPALSIYLGLPIHSAIATSMVAVTATGTTGAARYIKQNLVDIKLGIFLEMVTVIGVMIGVFLALRVSGSVLYILFSCLLFCLSFTHLVTVGREERKLIRREYGEATRKTGLGLKGEYYDENLKIKVPYHVTGYIKGSLMSFLAGMGSGLLGIGGGVFKVAAMNLLMNVPLKVAIATSKFMISITAATGSLLYYLSGTTPLPFVAPCALGTMIGVIMGTKIMNRVRSGYLKILLFLLTFYLGFRCLERGLGSI